MRRSLKSQFCGPRHSGFSANPVILLWKVMLKHLSIPFLLVVTDAPARVMFLFETEHRRLRLCSHENKSEKQFANYPIPTDAGAGDRRQRGILGAHLM